MPEYSNQEWLEQLRAPDNNEALAQLRDYIQRGLRYALSSRVDPNRLNALVEDSAQDALLRIDPKPTNWNAFLFGIVYAVSSLSCSLPIFLVVVGTSLAGADLFSSAGQFVGYALGMGVVVFAVVLGAAFFRQAMLRWLDRAAGYVQRFSALFVLGAGAYLIYYWLVESRLF